MKDFFQQFAGFFKKKPLNYAAALKKVEPYIFVFNGYKLVSSKNTLKLLGQTRFDRLTNDKIRNVCPSETQDAFYYWNVVTYLMMDH